MSMTAKPTRAMRRYLAEIGRKGGQSTSPAKQASSRVNALKKKKPIRIVKEPTS